MMLSSKIGSDTNRILFAVRCKLQLYGDGSIFWNYTIVMRCDGKDVGVEEGPQRKYLSRADCRNAAYKRIRELKTHRLLIVNVSQRDIREGEARSCRCCAIAQAIYKNQQRIGLGKYDYEFSVEPYAFGLRCDGILLRNIGDSHAPPLVTGVDNMPDLVSEGRKTLFIESMYQWAVHWDDWAESRCMTAKEWRGDTKPYRPEPCSFVLNLSEMRPSP